MSARDDLRTDQDSPRRVLPPPSAPVAVARELVRERFSTEDGTRTLRIWRGGWWEWQGTHWSEIEKSGARAALYGFTENATYQDGDDVKPWSPNMRRIADLHDALRAISYLPETVPMPCWLDGKRYDGLLVSCTNGLLDVGSRRLLGHDPRFFNATSVPFPYDAEAPKPTRWLGFVNGIWKDDPKSVDALQEWFGYVISGRLDQHKILLPVGPTRSGKGVISRILSALVGDENVAGPLLSSLNTNFGLQPLLGKTLAVIADARINGRGTHAIVERLLSISGEDSLTVDRKNKEAWTGKLPCRLMLCSNELPQLGDASMAVAGRFIPLVLTESWYGKEDRTLEPALREELSGILNWSLDGLERLTTQGRFTRPTAADETIKSLQDLASPLNAFVRDVCVRGPNEQVSKDVLYARFKEWAEENGQPKKDKNVFVRDVTAALGGRLKSARITNSNKKREYVLQGVRIREQEDVDDDTEPVLEKTPDTPDTPDGTRTFQTENEPNGRDVRDVRDETQYGAYADEEMSRVTDKWGYSTEGEELPF